MSKPLMLGIGIGFEPQYSSCLRNVPKNFNWTTNILDKWDHKVYVDFGIFQAKDEMHESCIGWLSESSAVVAYIIDELSHNINLRSRFKVIYTHDYELIKLYPSLFKFCPNGSNLPWLDPLDYKFVQKTKACSIIASEKRHLLGHKLRHEIISNSPAIDAYGKSVNRPISTKDEALRPYMFSVVTENSSYDGYVTEKLMDCFATRTIPLYWGVSNEYLTRLGFHPPIYMSGPFSAIPEEFMNVESALALYSASKDAVEHNWQQVQKLDMADDVLFCKIEELS